MAKITMFGSGHSSGVRSKKPTRKTLEAIVLPGIGDVIYTWYKLINYVDLGYDIDVFCLDCEPQRSHQILGCLRGMRSFEYISGFEYHDYWLVQVPDLRDPPPESLFEGKPVLHVNSWPESGRELKGFMPDFPFNYNIELTTNEEARKAASEKLDEENFNLFLYTSSYENNINCDNHPDPGFWGRMAMAVHEWFADERPLKAFLVGASYDADLTLDTQGFLSDQGVNTELVLDQSLFEVMELLRGVECAVAYESGFAMMADCMKTPLLWFIRDQGGDRDNHFFPYSGSVNPEALENWVFPFFYDQDEKEVLKSLEGKDVPEINE